MKLYLNVSDIADSLGISWRKAKRVYEECDRIEREELANFRIEPRKVRITTLCKVAQVSLSDIEKLKKADGVGYQSAKRKVI